MMHETRGLLPQCYDYSYDVRRTVQTVQSNRRGTTHARSLFERRPDTGLSETSDADNRGQHQQHPQRITDLYQKGFSVSPAQAATTRNATNRNSGRFVVMDLGQSGKDRGIFDRQLAVFPPIPSSPTSVQGCSKTFTSTDNQRHWRR